MQTKLRHIEIEQDDRKSGLGGSDSPVVLGISPFKTRKELWQEKLGLVEVKELTSPAIKRGNSLEGIVADLYAEVKGRKVEVVKQRLVHPQYKHIYAHIDRRLIDDKKKGPGVLEIKCPGVAVFNKCKREGLQQYYIIQLQKYLGITGYSWGAFAVFSAEQWELIEFDVVPDKELIKIIFAEDNKFWGYVLSGEEPPEPEVTLDMEAVGTNEVTNMDKINPALWADMVQKYAEAKAMEDEGAALKDLYEAKLKDEMLRAGANVAEGGGARIYFREQAGKMGLDKKAFAAGNKLAYEVYESYLRRGKPSRPFRFYQTRPITRE
jgi:putative phage-type endonuclease